jgi:hypothetical protein
VQEEERPNLSWHRFRKAFVSPDSYGLVVILILATYVLLSLPVGKAWTPSVAVFVEIATVWVILHTSESRRITRRFANVLLLAAAVAAIISLLTTKSHAPTGLFVASSLLYFIAPISIVRHLMLRNKVDVQTLLGAIAAYLLIGMFFAFVYRSIGTLQASPFFGANGEGTMSQDLFFSFTTLTTTGYGNLVPAQNPGQTMAVSEMILGQLFLITAVGKLVSSWRPKPRTSSESEETG